MGAVRAVPLIGLLAGMPIVLTAQPSGWDKSAFLMPNVDVEFGALLGFQVGEYPRTRRILNRSSPHPDSTIPRFPDSPIRDSMIRDPRIKD